ncbi:MAG: maleylacetoacetate isomerase [Paracoccaceae bacterium]|nr:maleylacetoacetate isomerase [Paracoccaceae bacterium]MDG2256960.1 maleylacetoacetate isomerase [Paracoccaceae bacterium]
MQFHGYFRSSSSYRCRIAFNLKGLNYDFVSVHLLKDGGQQKSEAYKAMNPQGLVPTLEVDGQVLTQSPAILEWLDETYPEPPLLPIEPFERARVRAFTQVIACEIHPLQNLRVLQFLKQNYDQDQEGVAVWCRRWIGDGLEACEALLVKQNGGADFCFGDTPGMADIYLMPQVFSAARFGVDMKSFSNINRIVENCSKLEAFELAHPSKQPDAEA